MQERHIVFMDVLGIRRALATGNAPSAERKLTRLAEIVENVIPLYPGVCGHGATDFFLLWSSRPESGWNTALAARHIFQSYFDLNEVEHAKDIDTAYLLRAGLAYGEVRELSKTADRISYSLLLGGGLAAAYETQASRKGMRLFLAPGASRAFHPTTAEERPPEMNVKIDRYHKASGELDYSEIRWVGYGEEVEPRVARAAKLFRNAARCFRRNEITEGVVLHYQQTLCATLAGCSSPELLLTYLTYRHRQRRAYPFLGAIWATAWLRLFRPKNAEFIQQNRDSVFERFLIMSGSPIISEVCSALSRYNRWRPLIRFLRSGKLRFASRDRSGSKI